jgi:hypothetical protein
MPIIAKTLLDHITLQFSYGGEHQAAALGQLEGAHFSEVEYFIDEATGKVLGQTSNPLNGAAQKLDPAKVAGVLGEEFATFAAQLAAVQAELAKTKSDAASDLAAVTDAIRAAAETASKEIAARDADIEGFKGQIATLTAANAAELANRDAQILALTSAHQDVIARNAAAALALATPATA